MIMNLHDLNMNFYDNEGTTDRTDYTSHTATILLQLELFYKKKID